MKASDCLWQIKSINYFFVAEFSSSDNIHVQSMKLVADNDDETVDRTTLQMNFENQADQIQNDEAVEFFEEKSFKGENHFLF